MGLIAAVLASASSLTLLADVWCPHTCAASAERPGYLVEVARAALQEAGTAPIPYETANWSRVRRELERPQRTLVVLGVTRGAEQAKWHFVAEPITRSPSCFFTRSDSSWRFRSLADLRGLRLGVTRGYQYAPALEATLAAPHANLKVNRVQSDDPAGRHLAMLQAGHSDVILEDRLVVRWLLERGAPAAREAGCIDAQDNGVYLAVPRGVPQAEVVLARLEQGVARLRRSGELDRILDRYGVPRDAR